MKYLVMECHPGYAVVLDSGGRFVKVANCGYAVGQTVERVVPLRQRPPRPDVRRLRPVLAAAACLCVLLLGAWRLLLTPYGTVRMEINPTVELTVNRFCWVLGVRGLNDDGAALLEGYAWRGTTAAETAGALARRAGTLGQLTSGGTVVLTVDSSHEPWRQETEAALTEALAAALPQVHVTNEAAEPAAAPAEPEPDPEPMDPEPVEPNPEPAPETASGGTGAAGPGGRHPAVAAGRAGHAGRPRGAGHAAGGAGAAHRPAGRRLGRR